MATLPRNTTYRYLEYLADPVQGFEGTYLYYRRSRFAIERVYIKLRMISPEDLYNFKFVYEPQISSDGSQVLFTVSQARRTEDDYDGAIWRYSQGLTMMPLVNEGNRSYNPKWSPDNHKFLFLVSRTTGNTSTNELWICDKNGLNKRKLVSTKERILQPKWSYMSESIFFLSDERPQKEINVTDVKLISRRNYRVNGEGYTYNRRSHLFRVATDSGNIETITHGDFNVYGYDVSSDGKSAYVVSNTEPDSDFMVNLDIFKIDLERPKLQMTKLVSNPGPISGLSLSPDRHYLAFIGNDYRFKFNTPDQLWFCDVGVGKTWRAASSLDQAATNSVVYDAKMGNPQIGPIWSSDSKRVYFLSTSRGECNVYSTEVVMNEALQLTSGKHVVNSFTVSSNNDIVYSVMDPLHLPEIYLLPRNSKEVSPKQITNLNSALMSEIQLSAPEKFTFKARDGIEIDAWYWPPTNGTKAQTNPCIIELHGGGGTEGYTFMHEYQCLCAQGFALVTCNFRGTQGYGERYSGALTGHYLEKDYTDNIDLAHHVTQAGWADKNKLGLYGGSYGGLLTNWIIGHETMFSAAVTDRSLTNLYTFHAISDDYRRIENDYYGFYPWDDIDGYYSKSPIKFVKNIQTPLLIIHSEEDYICPISEAEQLFGFLRRMNKEVVFARFPGENHNLSRAGKPKHRVERLNLYLWWFTSHIESGKKILKPL